MKKLKISIIGATGYAGKELVKILMNHPKVELVYLTSSTYAGKNITEIFPEFLNKLDKKLINLNLNVVSRDSDLIFTALPHTISMDVVPELLKKGVKVIDLSADYRIKDPVVYKKWYKKEHNQISKGMLSEAVYGFPEIYLDKIKEASLVANPGCYPTSIILGIAPLLKFKLVDPQGIIIDSKSGATGAGRKLSLGLHFSECNENFKAYKVVKHNHNLNGPKEEEEILKVYQKFYQEAPFVRIFEPPNLPEIKVVAGTNYCDIGFTIDERVGKIKIISVIDNLLKGAAGQAVQNMNIMSGFPETEGIN